MKNPLTLANQGVLSVVRGAGAGIENVDQSRSKPCFDGAAQSQGTLLGTLEKIAMAGYLAS